MTDTVEQPVDDRLRTLAAWAHSLHESEIKYEGANEALIAQFKRAGDYRAFERVQAEEDARRSIAEADGWSEVYFLRESGMGAIKIGVTVRLQRRLGSMRSNTPHEITLLGRIHADNRLETFLKDCFAHVRIRGEWFRPIPELMQYIATLPPFDEHLGLEALFEKRRNMKVLA